MKKTELKPYPNNPRQISQEQFERLGNSMEEFGDLSGIVFNAKDGYLISGHQRVASLKERYGESAVEIKITEEKDGEKRGFVEPEHIQYREVSWDEGKAGLARLAANKHGGEWDDDLLQEELDKLVKLDVNIELSGFDNLNIKDEGFVTSFESPDGDKEPFQQMTFTLADKQAELIKNAMVDAKKQTEFDYCETFQNENSNGNALYYIVSQWVEQRT